MDMIMTFQFGEYGLSLAGKSNRGLITGTAPKTWKTKKKYF